MPDFYPDALEAGTLSYPAIVSLGEGALYLRQNMEQNREKTEKMCSFILANLKKISGIALYSKPNPYGITAFSLGNMQSEVAAFNLSEEFSICVRGGLHCAPKMHEALSSDGLIRASLSSFNSMDECATFVFAVSELAKRR